MPNHKGATKVGGRQKGTPNKETACMRKAWTEAFDALGGSGNLAEWAKKNQTEFYKLASKLIPTTIAGDKENPLEFTIKYAAETARGKLDGIIISKNEN